MERLELIKVTKNKKIYTRETARKALENVIQRIKEANKNDEFIYRITKAVLFGSYINTNKEKVGDLDIAIYLELKNHSKPEYIQNRIRALNSLNYVPFLLEFIYGREEVFKFIKNRKQVLELHDGVRVDEDAKQHNDPISYIYFDKYKIIYENSKNSVYFMWKLIITKVLYAYWKYINKE